MPRAWSFALLLTIIAIGAALRGFDLTARSMWFDESFSWRVIQLPLKEMMTSVSADVHPPLYYFVLRLWAQATGDTLFSLRLFSLLFACLTMWLVYVLQVRLWRSRGLALWTVSLLALSSWQMLYAQEARMYTLGTTLAVLSSILLLRAVQSTPSRLTRWLTYGISIAALAYVHYYGFFTIAAQVIWLVAYLCTMQKRNWPAFIHARSTWHAFLAGVLAFILYLPWLPVFLAQNQRVQASFWIPPLTGWSIPDGIYRMFIPTNAALPHWDIHVVITVIPILFVSGCFIWLLSSQIVKIRKQRAVSWLIVLNAVMPFTLSALLSVTGRSVYQDRFLIFAHIYLIMAVAAAVWTLTSGKRRTLSVIVVTIILTAGSLGYWRELDIKHRPGLRAAVEYLSQRAHPAAPIVVNSSFIFFASDYYLRREFPIVAKPLLYSESDELIHFAGGPILRASDRIGPALFKQTKANQLWVIDTTGFGSSMLSVPEPWQLQDQQRYPEIFSYQGDIIVSRYERDR